ncbi:hypothetical protein COCSUDRAFT_11014, partial [Coccomyxa subellipsoidea C-169]
SMLSLYGEGFLQAIVQVSIVYYAASIALHWIGPWLLPVKSIQVQQRQQGQVTREALYSLGPIAVKAAVLTVVEKLHAAGVSKLYSGSIDSFSKVLYVLVTIIVLDYLHDAWFYWTHRALHSRFLYKHVHHLHHKSVAPTAFTGYSFHVVEAAIVFANEVLVCFLFPIHIGVHRIYHLFTTVIHNGGHAGYEIAPFIPSMESLIFGVLSWVQPAWNLRGGLNTVRHHDMHHRFPTRHFSLYFTHWDRWCGTEHVDYRTAVSVHYVLFWNRLAWGGSAHDSSVCTLPLSWHCALMVILQGVGVCKFCHC